MKVTLDGITYQRIGQQWFDESYIKPADVIIHRLDQYVSDPPTNKPGAKRQTKGKKRPSSSLGLEFAGLQQQDFQQGTGGTTWRRRASLGGLLAQQLTDKTGQPFLSYAVYRRGQVYIAMPERFDEGDKFPYAKFDIRLSEAGVQIGLYVEKRDRPMPARWDWRRLLTAVADDEMQACLTAVMQQHDLCWMMERYEENKLVGETAVYPANLLRWEEADTVEEVTWAEFVTRLHEAPLHQWLDLRLGRHIGREDALSAGIDVADQVVTIYAALLPLYNRCTQAVTASVQIPTEEDESSFTHRQVFPIIADVIRQLHRETQGFVSHEAIVSGLLDHPEGCDLVESAQAAQENNSSLEAIAGNMVAWFSQRITIHDSDYESLFAREQIDGKWAYRPVD